MSSRGFARRVLYVGVCVALERDCAGDSKIFVLISVEESVGLTMGLTIQFFVFLVLFGGSGDLL